MMLVERSNFMTAAATVTMSSEGECATAGWGDACFESPGRLVEIHLGGFHPVVALPQPDMIAVMGELALIREGERARHRVHRLATAKERQRLSFLCIRGRCRRGGLVARTNPAARREGLAFPVSLDALRLDLPAEPGCRGGFALVTGEGDDVGVRIQYGPIPLALQVLVG